MSDGTSSSHIQWKFSTTRLELNSAGCFLDYAFNIERRVRFLWDTQGTHEPGTTNNALSFTSLRATNIFFFCPGTFAF